MSCPNRYIYRFHIVELYFIIEQNLIISRKKESKCVNFTEFQEDLYIYNFILTLFKCCKKTFSLTTKIIFFNVLSNYIYTIKWLNEI